MGSNKSSITKIKGLVAIAGVVANVEETIILLVSPKAIN